MSSRRRVLFLCTGNSCRSQMAEAIANERLADRWEASSAGTSPAAGVHPLAVQVLAELGITHRGRPKPADTYRDVPFDLVVTVCDGASESCPIWLGTGPRVHLGFPDPARVAGSDEDVLTVFRSVRDDIAREVPRLLEAWDDELPAGADAPRARRGTDAM